MSHTGKRKSRAVVLPCCREERAESRRSLSAGRPREARQPRPRRSAAPRRQTVPSRSTAAHFATKGALLRCRVPTEGALRRKALHRQKPTTLEDGGKQPLTCAGVLICRSHLRSRECSRPKKLPAHTSALSRVSRPRPRAQLQKLHQDGAAAEADTGAARTKGRGRRGRSLSCRLVRGVARDPSLRRTQLREPLAIHRRDARSAAGAARPQGAVAGAARPCSAAAGAGIAAQPQLQHGPPSTPYSHRRCTAATLP